ncbi:MULTISPECIES: arylsulfotransferase family protein [Mycobacterium]|nr:MULTISPECIES: arylsulfotransferase family protein [Mycobacterium]
MPNGISRRRFGMLAGGALAATAVACSSTDHKPAPNAPSPPPPPGNNAVSAQSLGYTVNVDKPGGAPGYVFFVSGTSAANPTAGGGVSVLVIADKAGRVVWQRELPPGQVGGNLRVQTYQGRPVLTWWQGLRMGSHGIGFNCIADQHYNVLTTLTPGGDLSSDIHEFRLTPDGHALITAYQEVTTDLTAVGGPKDGRIFNCIATVVDVATRKTLFQWDALSHVPVADSPEKHAPGEVFDPYHMNSIALDPAGNLLISLRAVSTVFNIDPRSGAINWQLGGKHSTFELGDGVEFAFQHDAEMPDPTTLTVFDNHFEGSRAQPGGGSVPTRLKWIRLDFAARTATLVRAQPHPGNLSAGAMGNLQQLPGGTAFSGWGTAGHIAEFAADGDMLYDATLTDGTYRAFLDEWTGDPVLPPQLMFTDNGIRASWNGATTVARWRLLHGTLSNAMTEVATVDWSGYDTPIPLRDKPDGYYQVQALDGGGAVLNQTPPLPRPR